MSQMQRDELLEEAIEALKDGIRWRDAGPCWCQLQRKKAAVAGKKYHSSFCQKAYAVLEKATQHD